MTWIDFREGSDEPRDRSQETDAGGIQRSDRLPLADFARALTDLETDDRVILYLVEVMRLPYQDIAEAFNAEKASRGETDGFLTREDIGLRVFAARKQMLEQLPPLDALSFDHGPDPMPLDIEE